MAPADQTSYQTVTFLRYMDSMYIAIFPNFKFIDSGTDLLTNAYGTFSEQNTHLLTDVSPY